MVTNVGRATHLVNLGPGQGHDTLLDFLAYLSYARTHTYRGPVWHFLERAAHHTTCVSYTEVVFQPHEKTRTLSTSGPVRPMTRCSVFLPTALTLSSSLASASGLSLSGSSLTNAALV